MASCHVRATTDCQFLRLASGTLRRIDRLLRFLVDLLKHLGYGVAPATPRPEQAREQHEIAKEVFTTLLADQVSRADSLNASAGVLAGLGGVVTTLAGTVTHLINHDVGRAGIAAAGFSVVLAVVGLMWRRPGREPIDLATLLDRILHTADVTLTEDVLLYADVEAAKRNDHRLRWKGRATAGVAIALAGAVVLIVIATLMSGT